MSSNSSLYTELEYIEGNGLIDTLVSGFNTGTWQIYVKWMRTATPTVDWSRICSVYANEQSNTYRIIANKQSGTSYLVNGNSKAGGGGGGAACALNAIHEGLIENGRVTVDGTVHSTPTQGNTISADSKMLLWGPSTTGRLYAAWAKKDGVYQYDMVPARRNSDGAVGMYDRTRQRFFENTASNGAFTAGPVVGALNPTPTILPSGYTPLEYIQSTGTQYIDTGAYITSNNLLVKTKVYSTSTSATEQDVFGNQDHTTGRTVFGLSGANDGNRNNWFLYSRYGAAAAAPNTYTPAAQNQIFNIDVHIENGQKWLVVDGVATETIAATDITNSNRTVQLFANGKNAMTNAFKGRMYYFQMWNNGTLVRNFIPARRNSDGAIGMYDTVGGTFYGNAGTGTFTAGPDQANNIYMPQGE